MRTKQAVVDELVTIGRIGMDRIRVQLEILTDREYFPEEAKYASAIWDAAHLAAKRAQLEVILAHWD